LMIRGVFKVFLFEIWHTRDALRNIATPSAPYAAAG
jgi:hypothetical protein